MNDIFIIGAIMFFGIPIIALLDYMLFMPKLKSDMIKAIKEYNETGDFELSPLTWLPACILESLFFICGLFLAYGLK
jgi:hypothetical protein